MRKAYLQNGREATAFKLQNTYRTLKAVASLAVLYCFGCRVFVHWKLRGHGPDR